MGTYGPTATLAPAGAIILHPGDNVSAIVNAAPVGATFYFEAGVYRGVSLTPKDGQTFIGAEGAVLNGSAVLTSWTQSGNLWVIGGQTQQGPVHDATAQFLPGTQRPGYPDTVFVDNTPLKAVDALSKVVAGTFYFDYAADKIYIADNPTGHTVEAGKLTNAFNGYATNVTIQNLVIEKYDPMIQHGAIDGGGTNWIIQNNEVRLNYAAGITARDGSQILGNYVHDNGQLGIGGSGGGSGNGILVQGNEMARNGFWSGIDPNWEAGGLKFSGTDGLVVRGNYSHDNNGPGLWSDIDSIHTLYENNVAVHNTITGISYEISYDATIRNNTFIGNGYGDTRGWGWGSEINIQNSQGVQIYGNKVDMTGGHNGIILLQQDRGSGAYGFYTTTNNQIHDNIIVDRDAGGTNGGFADYNLSGMVNGGNTWSNNQYYMPDTGGKFQWSTYENSFASFKADAHETGSISQSYPDTSGWLTGAASSPSLSIAAANASLNEGNSGSTAFTFTVTRTGDTTGTSSASYGVTGSGANPADATDFTGGTLPTGTVSFAAGETSKFITVSVAGDSAVESNEGFTVTLKSPSSGTVIGTGAATGSILNDDSAPPPSPSLSIAAANASLNEGDSGSTAFTFTVTRTGSTTGTSSASYAVTGSGANPANATDFTAGSLPTGTVSFAAGETAKTITINVAGDTAVESHEGFTVTLSSPSAGTVIGTAAAAGTILNDDGGSRLVKAVNVGGPQVTASNGIVFQSDPGPTIDPVGSQIATTAAAIAGTTDDALYQDERWTQGGSYTYEVPVANGTYQVDLMFAEIYSGITGPGQRVFDMTLEGQALPALQDIDIYSKVGANTALTISQQITVSDGSLSIQVGPGDSSPGNVQNAMLDAFAIYAISSPPPTVTEKLVSDTGSSASDKITSSANLTGTADPNATIKFTIDGTAATATATADGAGKWSYAPIGLADGQHTIVASETNAAGQTGSATLTFTLDTKAPVVTEALVGGGTTSSTGVLSGTADPNGTVNFTIDGVAATTTATADATGKWSYTPTGLAIGAHTVVAKSTDAAGNAGSASLTFTLAAATVPPTVTEKLATDTGSSATDRITSNPALSGTGDANATVKFTIDGAAATTTATADGTGKWNYTPTGLVDGQHTIVASETNASGQTGSATLTFTLDTKGDVPAFTAGSWANGQMTVTGTTAAAVESVSIYDGGAWAGFATADGSGKFSFTTAAAAGSTHSFGAVATDLAGNVAQTATPFTYTAPSAPPPTGPLPVVTEKLVSDTGASATDLITSNAALTGTVDPNSVVHFTVDGSAIATTVTADATGQWNYTPTGLSDGVHTVMASVTNAAGQTGAAVLAFTYDTHAPIPTFTSEIVNKGKVTVTGTTGEAGDQVSIYDGSTWVGFATTGSDGTFSFTINTANKLHTFGANATGPAGEGHGTSNALLGTTGANVLTGGAGNDLIVGNGGNDVITGGLGADKLTGGTGSTTFTYKTVADSTAAASDVITDFQHGVDKIDFTAIAGINASGGLPTFQGKLTGTGNLTLNAHSVAVVESGGNTQVLVNTSNAAETVTATDTHAADMKIVLLGVNLGMTATDFHHS